MAMLARARRLLIASHIPLTQLHVHFAYCNSGFSFRHDFWIILLKDMKMWCTVSVTKALTTHAITGIKVNQHKATKKKRKGDCFNRSQRLFCTVEKSNVQVS